MCIRLKDYLTLYKHEEFCRTIGTCPPGGITIDHHLKQRWQELSHHPVIFRFFWAGCGSVIQMHFIPSQYMQNEPSVKVVEKVTEWPFQGSSTTCTYTIWVFPEMGVPLVHPF